MAKKQKACRSCHLVTSKDYCPKCKTHTLSDDYSGVIIVLDPKESALSKRLNIDVPGKYAIRVR